MAELTQILGPDGEPALLPTIRLTSEEAELLRHYKKFLEHHQLREALYCNKCWTHNLSDGLEAHVTQNQILFRCRCTVRIHQGLTY